MKRHNTRDSTPSAFAAQQRTLEHFRAVLHNMGIGFDVVEHHSDGVRVCCTRNGVEMDEAAELFARLAGAYTDLCSRCEWRPARCHLEVTVGGATLAGHVEREWLPDRMPTDTADEAVAGVVERVGETVGVVGDGR